MNIQNTQSNTHGWVTGDDPGLTFVGEFATVIYYDMVEHWAYKMENTWQGFGQGNKWDTWGVMISRGYAYSFGIGRHQWNISNEGSLCNNEGDFFIGWLKLTGCVDGQFTCNDGQCVMMEERCNQIPNCRDESDERLCELVVLKDGYNKKVPPIATVSATDMTLVPVPVTISITLLKIVSMEEVAHSIDLQFQIVLQWRDNRLTYLNLKTKSSLNALSDYDIFSLWLPRVIYSNTDQKETTKVGEEWGWSTAVTITREGNFSRSPPATVDEIEIFQGEENSLVLRQVYTKKFQCKYYLHRYPFDTQVRKGDLGKY